MRLQNRQSPLLCTTLPFRRPGSEYGMIWTCAPGKNPGARPSWLRPLWRGGESVACKNCKGLRDIAPASDLEPFRTSSRKLMWTYERARYYTSGGPRSRLGVSRSRSSKPPQSSGTTTLGSLQFDTPPRNSRCILFAIRRLYGVASWNSEASSKRAPKLSQAGSA